jgi:hypothetical protein
MVKFVDSQILAPSAIGARPYGIASSPIVGAVAPRGFPRKRRVAIFFTTSPARLEASCLIG